MSNWMEQTWYSFKRLIAVLDSETVAFKAFVSAQAYSTSCNSDRMLAIVVQILTEWGKYDIFLKDL